MIITRKDVVDFINRNNLSNTIICLHSSFKSFGSVFDGPKTIINGFLDTNCTLLCPSFYYESETYPDTMNYENNGIDYSVTNGLPEIDYEELPDQIDKSMGIIPKTILKYKSAIRETNPHDSFCAVGIHSEFLFHDHSPLNVYSAYKNIYNNDMTSYVILAGVNLKSCTPIHFAEEKAGRRLFRRWAIYHNRKVEIEVGSCSDGFDSLSNTVKSIETIDYLGTSKIKIYPFKAFIDIISNVIKNNPTITKCNNPLCLRCKDMISGGRFLTK
jgi:aminoglycoside N3'-acetyltransferase